MMINIKECIWKKYSPNKCKQCWMSSCHSRKRSCSHCKCYHKNTSLTFSPGTGCALGSQTWPAGCQKLRQDPGRGTASERGTESCHLAKARSAPRARSSLWTRAVAGALSPAPVGQESGRPQWSEEGRWICFAKGVGLLAVGGLLYAPIPLACHGGYQGTTVIFLSISTSV